MLAEWWLFTHSLGGSLLLWHRVPVLVQLRLFLGLLGRLWHVGRVNVPVLPGFADLLLIGGSKILKAILLRVLACNATDLVSTYNLVG